MTTVNWQHNILAATNYSGTSRRIARMRNEGAVFPPPHKYSPWASDFSWSPTTETQGAAPDSYGPPFSYAPNPPYSPMPPGNPYGDRTYVFAFWSVTGSSTTGTPLYEVYPETQPAPGGGPWNLNAKAWYVWNFRDGPGDHAVEIDAFCVNDNDYIPDFFVTVSPDGPPPTPPYREHSELGPLSITANADGYLATGPLRKPAVITAWPLIGDGFYRYRFVKWVVVASLTSGEPRPFVEGSRIMVHPSNIMKAIAIYERVESHIPRVVVPPFFPRVVVPPFSWGRIVGIPAGQSFIIITPGGGVIPVGGDDPPISRQFLEFVGGLIPQQ